MLVTNGLTKRFGQFLAVDSLDLDVRPGDIYGFLGANGSGKTTTVRMVLGLTLATSGTVDLLGERMPRAGKHVLPDVGAMVEGPAAYPHLSGRANLMLLESSAKSGKRAARLARVEESLHRVGLGAVGKRPVKAYSLGMKQRLGLAAALLRSPRLLVLDEPTNGLDPQGIREIRSLLVELHAAGTTIFLSSHLLAEVEQLCTRVGVLDRGRLVLQEYMSTLRAPTGRTLIRTPDAAAAVGLLNGRVERRDGDRLYVRSPAPAELNSMLVGAGVRVTELLAERRSLEEIVLDVTEGSGDVR